MGAHLTCNNNGGGNISNNNNNIHEHGHGHDECGAASSCIGLNMNSWLPRQAAGDSCRFSAEIYRLSEDQCRWVKVHPEVLTVKVNRTLNGAGTDSVQSNGGGATIALLEASMLETTARNESRNRRGKEQQPATTTTILSLPIPEGTQLKRYTEKFVYWRQNASKTGNNSARDGHGHSNSQVFALNLISSTDLDSFCSALNCLPPTPNMAPRLTKDEQVFEAHMAPLMALHRDRVEENPVPLFTKCRILFRERDSIVHLLDERDQLLARMSVTECIFALLPSADSSSNASSTPPSPLTCQLSISFPARALLLQFPSAIQQLNFCRHALNASSARMAGTREVAAMKYFLQKRLDTLETVLDRLNFSTNGDDKFRQQYEAYQKPVLLCECDSTTAANRRRQSMAALLRYSMKCQIMALQENAIAGTSKQESLSNALQSSGSEFPFQQRPRHHVAHRVHLQAILNCQFSLQKTIDLLGHCHSSEDIEEKCEPSVVVAAEEGSSAHNNFTELELSTPSTSRNSSAPVKLQRIMLEILQSERIFVQDLNTLLMGFVLPSGLHFMLCVRELHRVHANFLHSLDYALTPVLRFLSSSSGEQSYDELKPILTRLSTLFIAKCGQFKVYSEYIFSHMYFQRLRNESPAFKELISSFAAPIGGIRTVDSLLIKPVQRLLKYPLFLGQLRELSAENSEERALCFKALKQMRTLANWLNEMQRIQEDYGGELAAIFASSLLKGPAAMASSTFCSSWPPLADLNQLQLFAHVRWLNAASANGGGTAVTITPLNCALFVFRSVVVLLERKRTTTQHQQQQELKEQNKRKVPLVLPSSQVQLFLKQQQQPQEPAKPEANGTAAADVQKKNNGLKSTTTTGSATVHFALAIRATADGSQTVFSSPHPQQQPRLLHFECCHPAVCQHLSLALHRQRQQFEANEVSDNKIGEEEKLESAMMGAWRMEASIDSGCSSSSDRGYSSGCAGDQHQQR